MICDGIWITNERISQGGNRMMATQEEIARRKREAEYQAEVKRQYDAHYERLDEKAAKVKAAEKVKAHRAWAAAGGDTETFERQWKKFYEELVYQRALNTMLNEEPPASGKMPVRL